MAHRTVRAAYEQLSDRLNRFPQGAPPSDLLYQILELLFSEKEAELVAGLPIRPFKVDTAAKIWKVPISEARRQLEALADRALLVDISHENGEIHYALPPPMAGFFEFSLMRIRDDVNQKVLSELFHQYITVEDEFALDLFCRGETQLGRTFVKEPSLPSDDGLFVLDWERASFVIETANPMAVGVCYCRHKAKHAAAACDAPLEICMTFNTSAASLSRHGYARKIDKVEGMELLHQAYENNLVQFGENCREGVNFICNCCGCCCEAMIAQRRFSVLKPIHTTNFIPVINEDLCRGCRACARACPVEAMGMVSANDPKKRKRLRAKLDQDVCLGCGVCVRICDERAISLVERGQRVIPPFNGVHKAVVMAIERGKLQNLLFDRTDLVSHRVMGAIFGAILRLPPVKRVLSLEQLRSRYLEKILQNVRV